MLEKFNRLEQKCCTRCAHMCVWVPILPLRDMQLQGWCAGFLLHREWIPILIYSRVCVVLECCAGAKT